jgi:hypothetical protein
MRRKDFYICSDSLEDNSHTSCVLVLLIAIGVIVRLSLVGCIYPSFYIKGDDVTRKVIESVTI